MQVRPTFLPCAIGFGAGLLVAAWAVSAPAREMLDTEKRLLDDLTQSTTFQATIPANSEVIWLEFAGRVFPGDIIYGAEPGRTAFVPRAIANGLAVNCDPRETRVTEGSISGEFTDTASFTTTHGWEIGGSVQFMAGWPAAGTTWSISATYSGSRAETEETSQSWTLSQGWSAPVLPRTEFDVQLQVVQQQIEGQAYDLDLELRGPAIVHYRPKLAWIGWMGSLPPNAFIGGTETSPTTGQERTLPVCRARYGDTTHPGKVVAGQCNISYAGREYEMRQFEVLVGDPKLFKWEKHERGSTNEKQGVVAGREKRDDRHKGKLYVCRAEHLGGTHPGKLVINDCMFGYGGKEIERNTYEILTFGGDGESSYRINVEEHLPLERRTFRISGEFRGAKAITATTVYGAARPVTEARCGVSTPIAKASEAAEPRRPSMTVERRTGDAQQALAVRTSAGPDLLDPASPYSSVDLSGEATARTRLHYRSLRLEQPPLFGADVLALQQALRRAGWPIRLDGFHGPRTDRALRHFQRASDLEPDGILGPRTAAQLSL